jgi:hypothetical protein
MKELDKFVLLNSNGKNKIVPHVRRMDGYRLQHAVMKYQTAGRTNTE